MTTIKVGIKFRPKLALEDKQLQWIVDGKNIKSTNGKHDLTFDNVFDEKASSLEVYDVLVKSIISKTLRGYKNGAILTYGQTASGKTHSMIGNADDPGVIVLGLKDIFNQIDEAKLELQVRVGYTEIYNNKILDLLDNSTELKIFESNGVAVSNHKDFIVTSEAEALKYFQIGNNCKRMCETSSNERSSRSHTIFQISFESKLMVTSKLYLVDLAGSEKPDLTCPSFSEGLHINKSLLTLGKIIRGLARNDSMVHVNFRECKLTRILSPALGGDSVTAVICTVSSVVIDETFRTICFAQDAKKIKTNPTLGFSSPAPFALKTLRDENDRLKGEISEINDLFMVNFLPVHTSTGLSIETPKRSTSSHIKKKIKAEKVPELEETTNSNQQIIQYVKSLLNQVSSLKEEKDKVDQKLNDYEKLSLEMDAVVLNLKQQLSEAQHRAFEYEREKLVMQQGHSKTFNELEIVMSEKVNKIKVMQQQLSVLNSQSIEKSQEQTKIVQQKDERILELESQLAEAQRQIEEREPKQLAKSDSFDFMAALDPPQTFRNKRKLCSTDSDIFDKSSEIRENFECPSKRSNKLEVDSHKFAKDPSESGPNVAVYFRNFFPKN